MRAREIASTPVIAVSAQATVEEVAREMLLRGFTAMPVVDAHGHLLGLVTESQLGLANQSQQAFETPNGRRRENELPSFGRCVVSSVMTTSTPALEADSDLYEVAQHLVRSRHRCLPVIDKGQLVGMLSWRDLLRAMLHSERA